MNPKVLAAGVLGAACIAAAASGAYLAVRQNAQLTPATDAAAPAPAVPAARPVAETEALVGESKPADGSRARALAEAPPAGRETDRAAAAPSEASSARTPDAGRQDARHRPAIGARPAQTTRDRRADPAPVQPPVSASPNGGRPTQDSQPAAAVPTPVDPGPEPARAAEPPSPPERQFEEVVVPASAVIGLQIETPVSSERARVEDRVEARVTRDVSAAGRVAIPEGSRVIGSVTLVEKGGKLKERARLGVRFHTLVLADGHEIPLRTEAIFREGESPAGDSARKIGGAAIGGAILGAIIGGGKGAAIGSAAGAAGGSAAVMNSDRNAATLAAGTIVTVRLASPATLEVERRN